MKILITSDWYYPVVNGVVTSVMNLKSELEKAGHEVRILTLSQDGHQRFVNDTYYLKSFKAKVYPQARGTYSFYNKFIPKILDWKPDIVHSQCEWFSFYFAKYIAFRLNIPLVHTYHTIYEDYSHYLMKMGRTVGKKLVLLGTNKAVNASNYVITPTDKARSLLLSYGIENPIITVPTGIDLHKFDCKIAPERKAELLKKYGLSSENRVLVCLGRVAIEKNIDELVENIERMVNSEPNIRLLIVGGGPYEAALRKKVSGMNMNKYIVFTGMVSPDAVYEYFQLGELFLCASQSEAQGLTYIEALASGLPLLCKYDDCLEGVLLDGQNGYFFDSFNDFEQKLSVLLHDGDLLNSMSEQASLHSKNFSKENFGEQIAKVYSAAIETYPSSSTPRYKFFSRLSSLRAIKGLKRLKPTRSSKTKHIK